MTVPAGENGHVIAPGELLCRFCDAASLPAGPRQSEGHFAARFGETERRQTDVFEGDAHHLAAYEVQAGPGGWIVEGVRGAFCPQCNGASMVRLRYGDDFRIVRQGGE